jgi:hypothetical protein
MVEKQDYLMKIIVHFFVESLRKILAKIKHEPVEQVGMLCFDCDRYYTLLAKHFCVHTIILSKNSCKNIFRTGKQNVWFLEKTNLGKFSLRHTCSRGG